MCFIIIFLIVYIRAWEPNRRHLHGHKLDGGTGPNWECAADSASTAALIYLHCSASAPPPPTSLPVSLSPSPPLLSSPLCSPLHFILTRASWNMKGGGGGGGPVFSEEQVPQIACMCRRSRRGVHMTQGMGNQAREAEFILQ